MPQYMRKLANAMNAQTRYMSRNPTAAINIPRIEGPRPVPRSLRAENVDVVTPYLRGGVLDTTMDWHIENTMDTPMPMMNPENRNSRESDVVAKMVIPMMKPTYAGMMTLFGPLSS